MTKVGKKITGLMVTCTLAACIEQAAASPIIQNGSFETGDLSGWQVLSGNVSIQHDYGETDGFYAAILGYGDNDGPNFTLAQTFATTAGVTYTISFDWASSPNPKLQSMDVTVTGSGSALLNQGLAGIGALPSPYQHYSYTFVADSSLTTLKFADTSPSSFQSDQTLDNVVVTAAVPEPATYLTLLAGLIGFAAFTKSRKSPPLSIPQ
jgi:hypothetical protein